MKKNVLIIFVLLLSFFIYGAENDSNIKLIKDYYSYLCDPDTLQDAYDISPKKVDFATFKKWYEKVVIAYAFDIKKNSDGSYTFWAHIGEFFGEENTNKNEVSLYEVTMKINKGKIVDSKSKPIDLYDIKTLKYNDNEIIITDNVKKNTIYFHFVDKKSGKKSVLNEMKYDRFGIGIVDSSVINDIFYAQYTIFDFTGNIVIDLKEKKEIKFTFPSIFVTPDKKYFFSYGDNLMTGGGLALEYYNGKKMLKIFFDENCTITEIKYLKKSNEEFIKFNTQEFISEKNEQKDETKEINLTQIIKSKK